MLETNLRRFEEEVFQRGITEGERKSAEEKREIARTLLEKGMDRGEVARIVKLPEDGF